MTGLRPFKLPHEGLRPLDPCCERPCGAGDSATHDYDNLINNLSRDKGCSDLYFSQITMLNICSAKPNSAKMG